MATQIKRRGLKNNSRAMAAIANDSFNDAAGAKKVIDGNAVLDEILLAAEVSAAGGKAIKSDSVLRISNTDTSVHYVFIGPIDEVPGSMDATNSMAIMPRTTEYFFSGLAEQSEISLAVKVSNSAVQVASMK